MYKIIQNEKVVDVVKTPHFFRLLTSGQIAFTDRLCAHGIVGSDNKTLYAFAPVKQRKLDIVTIEKITENEFNRLKRLLNEGQSVCADESALAKAKRSTISRLSGICNNKITSGFSVKLSDGKEYKFNLTREDQLNLLGLENQLNSGVRSFLYHAAGQPCRFFSREDMSKIINTSRRYILYHTTYFNVAKQYINSLTDHEKVTMFTYGSDVSSVTDDIVIKQILKNGGNL